jgi:hypothetical protein
MSLKAMPRDHRTWRNTADVFQQLKFYNLAELFYIFSLKGKSRSRQNHPRLTLAKYCPPRVSRCTS